MARCLQTLVISQKGVCDPTILFNRRILRPQYARLLQGFLREVGQGKWNPQNGTRPWIRLNLIAHYRQAGTALRRARMISKLWEELEREIRKHGLSDRTIFALSDAAMGIASAVPTIDVLLT